MGTGNEMRYFGPFNELVHQTAVILFTRIIYRLYIKNGYVYMSIYLLFFLFKKSKNMEVAILRCLQLSEFHIVEILDVFGVDGRPKIPSLFIVVLE